MNEIINLKKIKLDYPVYDISDFSLRNYFKNFLKKKRNNQKYIRSLDDINLKINKGEKIGLYGHNGSGKTSLLKLIAGIYEPTEGTININKSVYPLLDINMGLDINATGEQNIIIMGLLKGIKLSQIKQRKKQIIKFSGLKKFIYAPVRTYSSGIVIRLATSIALEMKPEILLIDEFFGAGDEDFRKKSIFKLKNLMNSSSALLFASHDLKLIKQLCNRILVFKEGKIIKDKKYEI